MEKSVSAADANRSFSQLLRGVRDGQTFVVTAHGRPIARIIPIRRGTAVAEKARAGLLNRLRRAPVVDVGRWTRDELYEDES